ncbi:fasciclin domain-containing protein [Gordonia hongkongensis]|uniref:Fasciclin domain-containing protein n=1 Tax=Gordonia hongkongensis TaxID=1701090 RepID=A0AAX3T7N6_9ACTN|nr:MULTISPECIES: fasciclin domain-containing protein [Gordonia]MCZ4535279.1 fasciclin domain-containing protein [Gordonia terrae]MBN0973442.1 fasciclin domain-containing protein [Gordonia sp. BP-119]MBN0985243.1 fasciclin domain-containing protein [Gordonia sp. BP-94]MBR7192533.1 fasciclin domain-containing protein [Gordonia sp. SCSIO 19800]MCT1355873.1 fasciclin domain-containing protein [Gordonia sp. p3-SID1431]
MIKRIPRVAGALTGLVLAVGVMAGCSSDDSDTSSETTGAATESSAMMSESAMADPAANLVGPGCAAYAEANPSGPASVNGMSTVPVATAAATNPELTTLTQALSGQLNPEVNLVKTLNEGEYTVFAPTDDAFAKLPPETVEQLKTDADLLNKILTYHVVEGQATPDQIVGEHTTLEGQQVNVTGSGDNLKVNEAGVVCGGVTTSNAQVYLIDSVLMPPAGM